jgi:MerR family redox-sensitive transcriptional activator SoxR
MDDQLTIGHVAARTGVATSALRFYEERGLISSVRTEGNQRRYARDVIRIVSVIRAAQELGISLSEVGRALGSLPKGRTPTPSDWAQLSAGWRDSLDQRIRDLQALRDDLDQCIGCGCLTLESCRILNPADRAAETGTGPRYLANDRPASSESA